MLSGRGPSARDIASPRHDPNNRISKPQSRPFAGGRAGRPINNTVDDEKTLKWVSGEDEFVLKQAKKKADIRVREGRAKPIDWLAVILRAIDPERVAVDPQDSSEEFQHDIVDPEGIFEGLDNTQLEDLSNDIASYITLEKNSMNQDYWKTMQVICKDRRDKLKSIAPEGRSSSSVASDVDKLLGPKTYEQLEALEKQIRTKLRSNEPIDVDYWEQLLRSLLVWKAKAKLKNVTQSVLDSRMEKLRAEQQAEADSVRSNLQGLLSGPVTITEEGSEAIPATNMQIAKQPLLEYSEIYDPQPLLKLRAEDKSSDVVDESIFLKNIVGDRRKILKLSYIPASKIGIEVGAAGAGGQFTSMSVVGTHPPGTQRFSTIVNEDFSQATKALYEREVARGVNENEEIFTAEEDLANALAPKWADKYRPRKPRYFNRVQMGYEWTKYNQTHYDHENPPPKVVQGYKFNIFYPDLIDKAKAPTYRIIRENGRKRGESTAAAGEEDTCLIRFMAGPPYEDIAFRIVDKVRTSV